MDTFALSNISIAVLSQLSGQENEDPNIGLGILSGTLDMSPEANGWCQLLPAGYFSAPDGRPRDVVGGKWFLDGANAERLIHQIRELKNDRLIDYEHQTLNAEENGQPAPAAGWWNAMEMEWRDGEGLYVKPRWTDKAREFIRNDEYRWLSAVFPYDKTTGIPIAINMAGLVNFPGLDGLETVSALKGHSQPKQQQTTQPKETAMDQWLKDLLASLGIEVDDDKVNAEQGAAVLSAVKALQTRAASVDALTSEVATLKASTKTRDVDLTQYVPKKMYDDAVVEIASLKGENSQHSADQLIKDALDEGRAFKREEDYLREYGKQQGVAALKSMLDSRAPVAALKSKQTDGLTDPKKPKDKDLNSAEQAVLKATGISKEAFLKTRDGE